MKLNVGLNAKRNIAIGLANRIILMIFPFVVRSIVNISLGKEFLGLSSLFASIMQVLSLTELGISSAMVYHMYKPIADNDTDTINSLLAFYKKAYRIIGMIIVAIGCFLMFFLKTLIHDPQTGLINVYLVFVVYILNTVLSYFMFAYKQSILTAYQRNDIISLVNLVVQVSLQSSQIAVLLNTKNFYLYVLCMPIHTIINNIWIGVSTKKLFPKLEPKGDLDQETYASIKKLVVGTFIQKACVVTRNSLDSICVSAFLGLALTGIYNNYYTVFNGIAVTLGIIGTSLSGGIGNHVAVKSVDDNFEELKRLDFLYMTISGICTACLISLYQPFMKLWMGKDMLLPFGAVVLMCLYFYILKMGDMRSLYSGANGLWWKMRYRSISETFGNVILNVVLGKLLGVYGIILSTIISLFVFNFLWSSSILFKHFFDKEKMKRYYFYHFGYLSVALIICFITYMLTNQLIHFNVSIYGLVLQGFLTGLVAVALYGVVFFRTKIFSNSINMLMRKRR